MQKKMYIFTIQKNIFLLFLLFIIIITIRVYNINKTQTETYLVVYNYHWKNYISYPFINDYYIPYLKKSIKYPIDVVFYGPEESQIFPIKSNSLLQNGWYSYYTLCIAYKNRIKDYSGYFFINDDVFFDPNIFYQKFNLTVPVLDELQVKEVNGTWNWKDFISYTNVTFHKASDKFIDYVCNTEKYKDNRICKFPKNLLLTGLADFFYIPSRLIEEYVILLEKAYEIGMFLEMAVYSVAYMFDYTEIIKKCFSADLLGECVFVHPIKYSNFENQKKSKLYMDKTCRHL